LQRWNQIHATQDQSLAIDGKTMRNAVDDQGYQTHIMSGVGELNRNVRLVFDYLCMTKNTCPSIP